MYTRGSSRSSSFSYKTLATLFATGQYPPFTYRSSYCRRIIKCSTAPFVITRTGAECRRRDANISDARAILSRPSRFRVFLEKLCNDARRFTPRGAPGFVHTSLHESDKICSPWIHRSIGYKECRLQQGRCHREETYTVNTISATIFLCIYLMFTRYSSTNLRTDRGNK